MADTGDETVPMKRAKLDVAQSDDDCEIVECTIVTKKRTSPPAAKVVATLSSAAATNGASEAENECAVEEKEKTPQIAVKSLPGAASSSRRRPYAAKKPVVVIDVDDDDEDVKNNNNDDEADKDSGFGSTSTLASVIKKPKSQPLPSVIQLASSPSASSADGGASPSPPPKRTRTTTKAMIMPRMPDPPRMRASPPPQSRKRNAARHSLYDRAGSGGGSGLSAEYVRGVFRPVDAYLARHAQHLKTFNRQIWRHFSENLQNDKTFTWKMRIRLLLHEALSTIHPDCHLIAVGSTINGCGAYNSDMDLCLCINDHNGDYNLDRRFGIQTLKKIRGKLHSMAFVKKVITIPAKVPILKMWFNKPYEALEVDLNINNTAGIYNSYLLHYYARVDDRFSALCLLVKNWAKRAKIGDAFNGTFNSYSLILMCVHFLQVACDPPILPNLQQLYPTFFANNMPLSSMTLFGDLPTPLPERPKNTRTIGELMIAFFKYFADFDYERNAISIARARVFPRTELAVNTDRFKFFIEEPFDHQNTARCITSDHCWDRIYSAIQAARDIFLSASAPPPDLDAFLRYFTVAEEEEGMDEPPSADVMMAEAAVNGFV